MPTFNYAAPVVTQPSGYTIHASHIEAPRSRFGIRFWADAYINILAFEEGWRQCWVLAETSEGALRIAKYHHGLRGSRFKLIARDDDDIDRDRRGPRASRRRER